MLFDFYTKRFTTMSQTPNNVTWEASPITKLQVWLGTVTFGYKILAALMIAIYLIALVFGYTSTNWCFWPAYFIRTRNLRIREFHS